MTMRALQSQPPHELRLFKPKANHNHGSKVTEPLRNQKKRDFTSDRRSEFWSDRHFRDELLLKDCGARTTLRSGFVVVKSVAARLGVDCIGRRKLN